MCNLNLNVLVLLAIIMLQTVLSDVVNNRDDRLDKTFVPLPINSKFWNPQLDDKTNMELIGIQYLDDSNKTEISDKGVQLGPRSNGDKLWKSYIARPSKREERYFMWGLFDLLRPLAWGNELQDASLRRQPKPLLKQSK